MMLSLPALYSLRVFYEGIPWTLAGNPETLSLLRHPFHPKEIISIHQKEWAWLFQEEMDIPEGFQNYLSSFQAAYLFSAHQPGQMIRGLKRAGLKKIAWIPSLPDGEKGRTLQTLQREILESEKIPWLVPEKLIFPTPDDLRTAREYLEKIIGMERVDRLWAIHPGSGSPNKNWPLDRFLETARILKEHNRVEPIFLLGPVEEETGSMSISMIQNLGLAMVRNLSLPLLAGVLSWCRGYLGNDSGISHLSAALGVPTAVIFGPTDPLLWRPWGATVRIIPPYSSCAPCTRKDMQNCSSKECLASVTVQKVLEVISAMVTFPSK
jgi:hypothetical protein